MNTRKQSLWWALTSAVLLLAPVAWAEVTIDWVTVGDPGNACDTQPQGCFGAVSSAYRIGKHEVTNAQYAEFLNAKAAADPNALYNTDMGTGFGGIARSGVSGSFTYSAIAGREKKPVNFVSFYDSLRFSNWLNNGQGSGDTETGAYTITTLGITNNSITRNAGSNTFLVSEDEWHKAAFYDRGAGSYFDYPADSDVQTTCTWPGATANTANCQKVVDDVTDVGSYTGSPSPSGTFDQGGNVLEWNDTIIGGEFRGVRGGSFRHIDASSLSASFQASNFTLSEVDFQGFRVASTVPAPLPSLTPVSIAVLLSLLGLAGLRKLRP